MSKTFLKNLKHVLYQFSLGSHFIKNKIFKENLKAQWIIDLAKFFNFSRVTVIGELIINL